MHVRRLKQLFIAGCFLFFSETIQAQSCIPTGIQGTTIDLLCNQVCSTLVFQVPHIKSSDSYTLVNIPYNPYPYNTATGIEDGNLYADDEYSYLISLPFNFCFYGSNYPTTVVGSNGIMTFDPANAGCANAWPITTTIPYAGGTICSSASTYYPKASIMGAYSDLDPRTIASPSTRKIQWETHGTAPCRKFVVSYYNIGVFGSTCGISTPNTFQMVIHESTGLIEIFTEQKACYSSTNAGRGIQGIQNWNRDAAVWVAGRNNSTWGDNNSGYRFVPSGGTSRYVISEMLDMTGTVIATADTLTTTAGLLDIRYPNFCVPAGTNQYVVRTRFSACDNPANILTSLDTITINRTSSLGATATTTNASCGPPDGIITVTVPAGVGTSPYTFVLDGGSPVTGPSPYTFTNVASGAHTVLVTDASAGCTSSIPVTVLLSGTISATVNTVPTACVGSNTGSVIITAAGGTGPYTFSLDGGPPVAGVIPYTFSNVTAGGHTVYINDLGTGCNSGSIFVSVLNGLGVSGNASTTPTACPGINTGTIIATALTGTAPFTWSLDGGPFVPGASPYTFTSVSGGAHTVTIRDAFNCNILIPVNVPFGTGVSGTASATATSCPGVSNGSITVTAISGTAPFTWSLDGGPYLPGASPFTFTSVSAGAHIVTINDDAGCTILVPVTVDNGLPPTATLSSSATACAGVNNGTITVNAASGPSPLTFSLDGGAAVAGTIPFIFTNVPAGGHTVEVIDAAGCTTGPIAVTVTTGFGVTGVANTTATSCPSASNGSITVDATAGTAPFNYQLDGGPPQSGANPFTFTNVAAGSHTVVITDSYGCSFTLLNVIVAAGPAFIAATSTTATSCQGAANGTITIYPNGGTAPFTFTLDGGAPQTGTPPYTFLNVAAGSHVVTVADGAGCNTGNISVMVDPGPALTTSVSVSDVLCNGGATGIITVTVPSIGTPPYEYSLDGITWQSSNIFNNLIAGTYTVYYRESAGCQGQQSITVSEPALLAAITTETSVTCNGGNDGAAGVTTNGGTVPYEYSIDNGTTWQASAVFSGLVAGTYTILVRDAHACSMSLSITITEPPAITASVVTSDASCNGGDDGVITVTANGGNPGGYQYSLDGSTFQASNIFNVGPGAYSVTVIDNSNCSTVIPALVGLSNNLNFSLMNDVTICEGSSVGLQFSSNATVWNWSPATGLSSTSIPDPVANPTVTTSYIVTATLDRCSTTDTVLVTVNPAPVPDAGPDGMICYGQSYQLQGSGGTQYAWTPVQYLSSPSVANPVSTPPKTMIYTVRILSDNNGCPSLVTDEVAIDVTPPIKVYTSPMDTIAYEGDQFQLTAVSAVPAANNYFWTPSFNLDNSATPNPVFTAGSAGDVIIYKVTATSPAGCMGEGFVRLRVYKGPELYVPTAFTPNADGLNDNFYPFPVGIKSINYFKVFNRWGQLMFSSNILYKAWDGKLMGVDQPSGVYVWMAEGVDKNNKTLTRKGTVTMIR